MLCLNRQGANFLTQGPVLKAADYAAAVAAQDLVRQAEEEAARIRAEAEEIYRQRKAQGHREGVEAGKAEMAQQVVATLGQSNTYLAKIEQALVDVVMKSTARVIGEIGERERAFERGGCVVVTRAAAVYNGQRNQRRHAQQGDSVHQREGTKGFHVAANPREGVLFNYLILNSFLYKCASRSADPAAGTPMVLRMRSAASSPR